MIERLVEWSAEAFAVVTGSVRSISPRRWAMAPARVLVRAIRGAGREVLDALIPARPPSLGPGLSSVGGLLQLLLARGGTRPLTRYDQIMALALRIWPALWRMSQDPRTRGAAALLWRIVFGHTRRPRS